MSELQQSSLKHQYSGKRYNVVLIDPPWFYYGDKNKNAAAGKHYLLMSDADIKSLEIKKLLKKEAFVFVWATGPKLDLAIEAIKSWGLYYRGVGHVWVKTNKHGQIIHAQGIPPTYSKPTTEFLLVATTSKKGRPLELINNALPQVVLEGRNARGHSAKPDKFYELIESAFSIAAAERLEIFARIRRPGWDAIGDALDKQDIRLTIKQIVS
jgi:N6-adenosine-specific RNA methylase IME4